MSDQVPSVLAIVVVRDAAPWLRETLAALARQTHRRFGVLAVDDGSIDGSRQILDEVLGPRRCIHLRQGIGFAGAVGRALRVPAAREADFLLLLHDDAALAPDAVERLLATADRVSGAGLVAPKIVDWSRPDVLLDIGSATDRFGYPYSPLEEDEIDQGQYDAVREVLFVSSAAMLVGRDAWSRAGPPDERLQTGQMELDFCWRIRLAGFRVLVNPLAHARHRSASSRQGRAGATPEGDRYLAERAGLLALLKGYRLITLLWVLPLYVVQALGRFIVYLFSRHADRAAEVARAWAWNLVHLPGTVRRRFRAQRARTVGDREIARFMSPVGTRLQRWALQASTLLMARGPGHVEEEEELEAPPLHRRVASLAVRYPVTVGLLVATAATLIAFRGVLFVPHIEGGSLPVFPGGPFDFFREFASGWRTTGFGGPGGASPALVALGLGSGLTLGQPMLLARLMVALTPVAAGASCYAAAVRVTRHRGSAVIAAACYALSALGLWVASEGSLPATALFIAVPPVTLRLAAAFRRGGPRRPLRWALGTGVILAVTGSFFPAVWVAGAIVVIPFILVPEPGGRRLRGVVLTGVATVVAGVLAFPLTLELLRAGGGTEVGAAGRPEFAALLRLSPGASPGSWVVALFLPVGAALAFGFADRERRWAGRALATAAGAIPLAWLAAAGYLPNLLANPLAYLAPAAFTLSLVVGLGVRTLVPEARRAAFGARQAAAAALVVVLAAGLGLQLLRSLGGGWAVGEQRLPPAWPVVATADPGIPFRVLWLGGIEEARFQPPGGGHQGTVGPAESPVAYGVTGRAGRSVLAVGLPEGGEATGRLEDVLGGLLSGRIRHGGALLAPFAIRFVVAGEDDLPSAAADLLDEQLDLDLVQASGGLRIYRNAAALPEAAALPGSGAVEAARSTDLLSSTALDPDTARALRRHRGPSWSGSLAAPAPSLVLVTMSYDGRWRLDGGGEPFPAFGWALGFQAEADGPVRVGFEGQLPRTIEVVAFSILWVAVLWSLAQPARKAPRGRRTRARHEVASGTVPVEEPRGHGRAVAPGGRR